MLFHSKKTFCKLNRIRSKEGKASAATNAFASFFAVNFVNYPKTYNKVFFLSCSRFTPVSVTVCATLTPANTSKRRFYHFWRTTCDWSTPPSNSSIQIQVFYLQQTREVISKSSYNHLTTDVLWKLRSILLYAYPRILSLVFKVALDMNFERATVRWS